VLDPSQVGLNYIPLVLNLYFYRFHRRAGSRSHRYFWDGFDSTVRKRRIVSFSLRSLRPISVQIQNGLGCAYASESFNRFVNILELAVFVPIHPVALPIVAGM
jgi:hypothetical protein